MRIFYFAVISLFLLISCSTNENQVVEKKTIIVGKVLGYEKVFDHNSVEYIGFDLFAGPISFSEKIDSTGHFRFELDLDYPTEFYFCYNDMLTFYISPGDSLCLNIDGSCWERESDDLKDKYAFYRISGTSKKMNEDVVAYLIHSDSIRNIGLESQNMGTLKPVEYKNYRQNLTIEHRKDLKEYLSKNNTGKQFQEWAEFNLKFDEWNDLMRYRWFHPMVNQLNPNEFMNSIPSEYFDFLKGWDGDNLSYFKSNKYISFLHEYSIYYNQNIPKAVFSHISKGDTNAFMKGLKARMQYIVSNQKGIIKEVLLAKNYFQNLNAKKFEAVRDVYFPDDISDKKLAERVNKKFEAEKKLIELSQNKSEENLNQFCGKSEFLKELIAKYPDKVIYIDFWAPWCGSCMNEMKMAKNLKKRFEGKDVVFVYLSFGCKESSWKSAIEEKGIEGEHFLLNAEQQNEFVQLFSIKGIPHYALIDRNGNVVGKDVTRPGSGEVIVKQIEALLAGE